MRLTRSGSRVTAKAVTGLFRYLLVAIMANLVEEVDSMRRLCGIDLAET